MIITLLFLILVCLLFPGLMRLIAMLLFSGFLYLLASAADRAHALDGFSACHGAGTTATSITG